MTTLTSSTGFFAKWSKKLPLSVSPFIAILVLLLLIAIFAPFFAPFDPNKQNLLARLKPPGFESRGVVYYLGSDELGRDVLSRLIYGARISLLVAISSVVLSGILGSILGMLAAFYRGWTETIIMRLANVVIVLALTRWPRYARVAYGQTLSVANMPYVRLSRFMGAGWLRLLWRHILPNIAGALIVVATLEFGLMVLFEAGLSFLGLGVQPPTASWGAMLSTGRNYVASAWWIATFPGLALFLLVLSINLIGDHTRDWLDPRGR